MDYNIVPTNVADPSTVYQPSIMQLNIALRKVYNTRMYGGATDALLELRLAHSLMVVGARPTPSRLRLLENALCEVFETNSSKFANKFYWEISFTGKLFFRQMKEPHKYGILYSL